MDALHHIDEISEKYKKRYDRFYDKFCHVDDGHASKRAIDIVFEGAKATFAETEEWCENRDSIYRKKAGYPVVPDYVCDHTGQ